MALDMQNVYNLETMLKYCSEKLNWPIEEDWFDDVDDLVYDFSAADLCIKEEEFSRIQSLKQLRPLVDDQPWGIFAVCFSGNKLEISALRRILRTLIPNRNNTNFKTWNYNRILFLCFWGDSAFRTVGFVAFQDTGTSLPLLKTLYCTPRLEDRTHLENFESRIRVLTWPNISNKDEWVDNWCRFFAPARGQTIRDTLQLTETLASTAMTISQTLNNSFAIETDFGFAHKLYYRFNNALQIELSQQDFIDMYAQTIDYDLSKVERNRYEIMKHFIGHDNYGLVMDRQVVTDNWSHIQIVKNMVDNRVHYSRKGIPVQCPMFLYDEVGNATPNIDNAQLSSFGATLSETFSNELTEETNKYDMLDIFDYCYGILSSNAYRLKYAGLLAIDFPRVPAPCDSQFFWQIVELGAYLRNLHLISHPIENTLRIDFMGTGDNVISGVRFQDNKVYINRSQYFTNIREDLWDFSFAGYHGLQKWFKDRRQQTLSESDIQHVINVFNVFDQSETYMAKLDSVLTECGLV